MEESYPSLEILSVYSAASSDGASFILSIKNYFQKMLCNIAL